MRILSDSLFAVKVKEELERRRRKERMAFQYTDKDGNTVTCWSHLTEDDILNAEPITDPERLKWIREVRKKYGIED